MQKHLAINKEFSAVKALLLKLNNLAGKKQIAYSFFTRTKEEIIKHLTTIFESKLSIERYNDLLQEVHFTFGDYLNQFQDLEEAEKYLTRAFKYPKATPFTDKARLVLANIYYAKGTDPNLDVIERLAYLRKSEALNEPTLVEYTQRTIVSTCTEALAVCDRTALLHSQEKDVNEKKLLASPNKFKDTAKRFAEPTTDPKKLLTVHLPSSPKF
jgi:tetratricopeptide (TPR) repeat protein